MIPTEIREALAWWELNIEPGPLEMAAIVGAARAYADLLENGEKAEWCEEHKSSGIYRLGNRVCWNGQFTKVLDTDDCHMVKKLIVGLPAEGT